MMAGVQLNGLQADLLFPYSKKNYHAVLFETKVDLHNAGNNMAFSENQYPVYRGLAEQAQLYGIPGESCQVTHF